MLVAVSFERSTTQKRCSSSFFLRNHPQRRRRPIRGSHVVRALKEDEDEDKEDKEHPENAIEPVIFSLNENSKRIKLADAARWLG